VNEIITINPADLQKADWIAKRDHFIELADMVQAVETDEQVQASGATYTAIKKHIKFLSDERLALTRRIDAAKKGIMDQEKEMVCNLEKAADRLKALNDSYATKKAAEAEAERRRIAEEERRRMEELARKEQAEAKRQQELAEKQARAASAFGASAQVEPPPPPPPPVEELPPLPPPPPEKMQIAGTRTVKRWSHVVYDSELVPRKYLIVDDSKIRSHIKHAEEMGTDPCIPGVKFEAKISVETGR
jgi:multidrug efflux pump subunit AcrA (membrane-fusion protein)